jgi:hypothetical protein
VKYQQPFGITDPDAPYLNGDPSIGRAGSIPPASAFEYPQREILHMIEKSLLTPSDADLYQLLRAIRRQRVNYVADGGTVNSLSANFDPAVDAYTNGLVVRIKVAFTNTGPAVIDCGPGQRGIVHIDGSPLAPGDMVHGGVAVMVYIDTEFQLTNPHVVAGTLITGAPGSGAEVIQYITNQYMGFQGMWGRDAAGTYDWTVPDGVQKVMLELWAGGGPGWPYGGDDWRKGGDGGYVRGTFDVVPGTLMRVTIGAGAPPPVPFTTGNVTFSSADWGNAYGQPSSFGPAGSPVFCSCTGGRGSYTKGPAGSIAIPGTNGIGTGGAINRANGQYGRGGGHELPYPGTTQWDALAGAAGAAVIVY